MQKYVGLLTKLNDLKEFEILEKDKHFFKSRVFQTLNEPDSTFQLVEYKYIDFSIIKLGRQIRETSNYDEDSQYITFYNIIFTAKEKIVLHETEAKKICFINCVFMSWVQIIGNPNILRFDNCVIKTYVSFNNSNFSKIEFESCVANLIQFSGKLDELIVSNTLINTLQLETVDTKNLFIWKNKIKSLKISSIKSDKIIFNTGQITKKSSINPCFETDIKLILKYSQKKTIPKTDEDSSLSEEYETALETLNFLKEKTPFKFDSIAIAKFEYLSKKIINKYSFIHILMWPFGYYLKPFRILLMSSAIISIFALIYFMTDKTQTPFKDHFFCSLKFFSKEFPDTYTNVTSLIQILERMIGIVFIASFPVSLVRRYLK